MVRRLKGSGGSEQKMRRNISGALKNSDVRHSNLRHHQDNLLFANCDTWTAVHCRHARDT